MKLEALTVNYYHDFGAFMGSHLYSVN